MGAVGVRVRSGIAVGGGPVVHALRKLATLVAVVVSMLVFSVVLLAAMVGIASLIWGTR